MTTPEGGARGAERVDVLVVGGGSAGLAAAVAAARLGASVRLVEKHGFLGGTLTMVTLGSICGLYTVTDTEVTPVVGGFAAEVAERLRREGGAPAAPKRWLKTASLPYDPFCMKLVCDDLATEARLRLSLHALVTEALMEGRRIAGVVVETPSGRRTIRAGAVIDATGDGDVAALAGAAFEHDPAHNQAPTAMVRFGGVDTARAMALDRPTLHACLERAVEAGLPLPRTAGGMFSVRDGMVHLNITRVLHGGRAPDVLDTEELTAAEIEGRRQVRMYVEAFRRFVPGFEGCFALDTGAELGVRESRRIRGEHWLELDEVMNQGRFPDAIACSAWPVEEHGAGRATKWVFLEPGSYYQLPYRMMVPVGVEGLLVAGRCASASHDAHASMRVAAVCMALGEAAGVAVAQCAERGLPVRQADIGALQRQLLRQGAFLGDRAEPPVHAEMAGMEAED
jgi:glycine/D-amino acid oxidase-like deaminating enzyme